MIIELLQFSDVVEFSLYNNTFHQQEKGWFLWKFTNQEETMHLCYAPIEDEV